MLRVFSTSSLQRSCLPQAVAVVVSGLDSTRCHLQSAPFRLMTRGPLNGLAEVASCSLGPGFHTHSQPAEHLFGLASHVLTCDSAISVCDMRDGVAEPVVCV